MIDAQADPLVRQARDVDVVIETIGGEVPPLARARPAHEMLAGKPHKRGKIVSAVHP